MPYPAATIEDYQRLGNESNCDILHTYRQLPPHTDVPVIWKDRKTGEVFQRSYHNLRRRLSEGKPGSPSATFLAEYWPDFQLIADYLGIELLYEEGQDPLPVSAQSPMKWRGRTGNVVSAPLAKIAYGDNQMSKALKKTLGIPDHETIESLAVVRAVRG